MTIFARPAALARRGAPTTAGNRRPLRLRLVLVAAAVAAVATAGLAGAATAGAIVVSKGLLAPVGLQPRVQKHYLIEGEDVAGKSPGPSYLDGAEPARYANPEGNPVLHGTNTWTIFWDPEEYFYHGDWERVIDTYMANAAAESGSLAGVFAVDTQYTDKSNQPAVYKQIFRGGAEDTNPYPESGCEDPAPLAPKLIAKGRVPGTTCLTSTQVAGQLETFIKQHNLPTGMNDVYYLLTPPGITVCLDKGGPEGHCSDYESQYLVPWFTEETESYKNSFCSYHADINPDGSSGGSGTILYGVIPWTAGTFADGDFATVIEGEGVNAHEVHAQFPGWECQDGGYNPASKPIEQYETPHARGEKEEEEFKAKNEREKGEEEEAKSLEGPHEQEPNQKPCPTEDGWCDVGLADLIINQIGVEQQNIVTDPLLTSWKDPHGYENTDECRFFFAPAQGSATANATTKAGTLYDQQLDNTPYYLNTAFNLAGELLNFPGIPCLPGVRLLPHFTAPSPVNAGEVVAFDGMESDITLDAGIDYSTSGSPQANYAVYTWNFGDGTPTVTGWAPGTPPCGQEHSRYVEPCAGSVFHTYEYGGTYEVTLSVRDVGGNTTSYTQTVDVSGPPRPASGGNAANTAGGAGAGAAGGHGLAAPEVTAVIVPQSLRVALRRGLVVSYAVNEQVAGHFEVLLSRELARKLHIAAAAATGLAAGTPPQLVIAKAILVTTHGGRSELHIDFTKSIAERLAHARKVPLMLRVSVRNASYNTTTALASATLSG